MSNLNDHIDTCSKHQRSAGQSLPMLLRNPAGQIEIQCQSCKFLVTGPNMDEARWSWNNAHALQRIAAGQVTR